jgi:hypothetical protein
MTEKNSEGVHVVSEETPVHVAVESEVEKVDNVVSLQPELKPAELAEQHDDISSITEMMPEMEMNFHITGKMNLKYHVLMQDEVVHLTINDTGLFIELDNGTKFSMPLWHMGVKKKSA